MITNRVASVIRKIVIAFTYNLISFVKRTPRGYELKLINDASNDFSTLSSSMFNDLKEALSKDAKNFWIDAKGNNIVRRNVIDKVDGDSVYIQGVAEPIEMVGEYKKSPERGKGYHV